jgi:hypothetical protein
MIFFRVLAAFANSSNNMMECDDAPSNGETLPHEDVIEHGHGECSYGEKSQARKRKQRIIPGSGVFFFWFSIFFS